MNYDGLLVPEKRYEELVAQFDGVHAIVSPKTLLFNVPPFLVQEKYNYAVNEIVKSMLNE